VVFYSAFLFGGIPRCTNFAVCLHGSVAFQFSLSALRIIAQYVPDRVAANTRQSYEKPESVSEVDHAMIIIG